MANEVEFVLKDLTLVSDATNKLFSGYMRRADELWKDRDNPYYKILESIQHIVLTYYYEQFCFDVHTPNGSNDFIFNDGMTIRTSNANRDKTVNAGYSVGFNKGIHKFGIKFIGKIAQCGFGVTTDFENAKSEKWFYKYDGWSVYVAVGDSGLYPWFGKIHGGYKREAFKDYKREIKDGDEVILKLDCDNWNIEYFHNTNSGRYSAGKCDIAKDKTYFVCFSNQNGYAIECNILPLETV